jgi:hypothetical protein
VRSPLWKPVPVLNLWFTSMPSDPASSRSIAISSHQHIGLPGCLLQVSSSNNAFIFLLPPECCMPHPSHPHWFNYYNSIWQDAQIMKHLVNTIFSILRSTK